MPLAGAALRAAHARSGAAAHLQNPGPGTPSAAAVALLHRGCLSQARTAQAVGLARLGASSCQRSSRTLLAAAAVRAARARTGAARQLRSRSSGTPSAAAALHLREWCIVGASEWDSSPHVLFIFIRQPAL